MPEQRDITEKLELESEKEIIIKSASFTDSSVSTGEDQNLDNLNKI